MEANLTRCTFCDHKNPPGATRCTNCGSELAGSLEAGDKSLANTLTALIEAGQKIEAIKQYRERTGSGLKEAKDAVEALERGEQLPTPKAILTTVDQDVVSLVREGKKIAAIKLYREKTGVGLAEAQAAVEAGGDRTRDPSPWKWLCQCTVPGSGGPYGRHLPRDLSKTCYRVPNSRTFGFTEDELKAITL
jgi:ribosomal protein L7/L12